MTIACSRCYVVRANYDDDLCGSCRRTVDDKKEIERLREELSKLRPLHEAVAVCQKEEVPIAVYNAWHDTPNYREQVERAREILRADTPA